MEKTNLSIRDTVRFEECAEIFWKVLQESSSGIDKYYVGIVYSTAALPKEIEIRDDVLIQNGGCLRGSNGQVHLLTVTAPTNLYLFLIPSLSEAIGCLLSFSFRSRFAASRYLCNIDDKRRITRMPRDLFLRLNSGVLDSLVFDSSTEGLTKGVQLFNSLIEIFRSLEKKNFERLIRSFRLYQLSLLDYSTDVGLAYSLLVSSVDNLSCNLYGSEGKKNKDKFVKFIEGYLPEAFWGSFDLRALEEDRRLDDMTSGGYSLLDVFKRRYEQYGEKVFTELPREMGNHAVARIKTSFVEKKELAPQEKQIYEHILRHSNIYRVDNKLARNELPEVLEHIYSEVRSAFFHGGKSPPQSATDRYETAPIKPKTTTENKVIWQRDIPSFYCFERIAHESITRYLINNFSQ